MVSSFLFFPERDFYTLPRDFGLQEEEVNLKTSDGAHLHGWFFSASDPKAVLLFFHGNAGNISGRLLKAQGWLARGVSVFLIDYRGFGKSGGKIEKSTDMLQDAQASLDWLEKEKGIPSRKVILYGESIGSFPAIHLARQKKFAGLILEAPFTNLLELARKHYGWVPASLLKDFEMANQIAIAEVQAPVFILHGREDEVCPVDFGERLYELAPSPKEYYAVPGGHHNDLLEVAGENYFEYPYRFLIGEEKLL